MTVPEMLRLICDEIDSLLIEWLGETAQWGENIGISFEKSCFKQLSRARPELAEMWELRLTANLKLIELETQQNACDITTSQKNWLVDFDTKRY